jgi:glycosyltransferase involved in cell wall biosynthesis
VHFPHRTFDNWLPGFLERKWEVMFNPQIALAAANSGARLVILEGEGNILNNFLMTALLRARGVPYIWWTMGQLPYRKISWRRKLLAPVIDVLTRCALKMVVYSTWAKRFYISQGYPAGRISVVQNMLAPEFVFGHRTECEVLSEKLIEQLGWRDHLRLIYIGALIPSKSPDLLIRAVARAQRKTNRKIGLFFVGEGPSRAACEALAADLQVETHFAGKQYELGSAYLMAAQVMCLPGLGGLAINHAMMLGRTVICGPADGTEADLVIDGKTGYYLLPMTEEGMADKVAFLADHPETVAALGQKALSHVNSVATIARFIANLFTGTPFQDFVAVPRNPVPVKR